jgi:hypothetical protein
MEAFNSNNTNLQLELAGARRLLGILEIFYVSSRWKSNTGGVSHASQFSMQLNLRLSARLQGVLMGLTGFRDAASLHGRLSIEVSRA